MVQLSPSILNSIETRDPFSNGSVGKCEVTHYRKDSRQSPRSRFHYDLLMHIDFPRLVFTIRDTHFHQPWTHLRIVSTENF